MTGDGVPTPVGNGLWRLPAKEVQWVLRRRIGGNLFGPESVEAVSAVRDEFFEYQAWLRAEHDAHGRCVLMDEQFVRDREEEHHQQWMSGWSERMTDGFDLGELEFRYRMSDFYEDSDDDDEGEEVEEVLQELETN